MKLRRAIAIGAFVFSMWRGYRGLRRNVRTTARHSLKRAYKAI